MFKFDKKTVKKILSIQTKIFADGADFESMKYLNSLSYIKGLTTNPSLMKKAGVSNYEDFAKKILKEVKKKSISFEVFSDDHEEMYHQAKKITSWAQNAYVKIPICNTQKKFSYDLIKKLSDEGIKLNITAIMTKEQIKKTFQNLNKQTHSFVSIFAGRIADTGVDPLDTINYALKLKKSFNSEIIWASTREVLNIFQCAKAGCDIITVTPDLVQKLINIDKNLEEFSVDTVKMFYNDALAAGYKI